MIERRLVTKMKTVLRFSGSIGILGPRQCGKSTLVKNLEEKKVYIDLENKEDVAKLGDPFLFFGHNDDKLICLDEIQFKPDIFVDIKSHIDKKDSPGQFLILGSASPDLLKQSSESLAGRIIYLELSGFLWVEIRKTISLDQYLFRGVLPKSVLAEDDELAQLWLDSYIKTFFERDLLQLSAGISAVQVERLFTMLAHLHGTELNVAKLSKSLDLAYNTVRSYIDILTGAFQLLLLAPYHKNVGKRLVKSPKVYISDPGIVHTLLRIRSFNQLLGHPTFGFSFEGLIIYNIMKMYPAYDYSFYRTSGGAELDLVMEGNGMVIGIEVKSSKAPKITRGFWSSLEDVKADFGWVIGWLDYKTQLRENIYQSGLNEFLAFIEEKEISE